MKNNNHNASVHDYWQRMNGARKLSSDYRRLRKIINESDTSETWPFIKQSTGRPEGPPQYVFEYGLTLTDKGELGYFLRVCDAVTQLRPPLESVPVEVLVRYTELKRALDDYLKRDGDWPTPDHMPGGSQLVPG